MKSVAALPFAVALAIAVPACSVGHHAPPPAATAAARPQTSSAAPSTGTVQAQTVYVMHNAGWFMTPVSTITNAAGKRFRVAKGAMAMAVTPDGKTIYVANWRADTVTPIATATNTPGKPIKVGKGPFTLVIAP